MILRKRVVVVNTAWARRCMSTSGLSRAERQVAGLTTYFEPTQAGSASRIGMDPSHNKLLVKDEHIAKGSICFVKTSVPKYVLEDGPQEESMEWSGGSFSSQDAPVARNEELVERTFALSCLHIVYPFHYPQYYDPLDQSTAWVHYLRPDEVKCTIEVINLKGEVEHEHRLGDNVITHPFRDLLAIVLSKEDEKFLETHKIHVHELPSEPIDTFVGQQVEAYGHVVDVVDKSPISVPYLEQGEICFIGELKQSGRENLPVSIHQTLAHTGSTLSQGMCGGVLVDSGNNQMLGVIEGILSPKVQQEAGTPSQFAAVIDAYQIYSFLTKPF